MTMQTQQNFVFYTSSFDHLLCVYRFHAADGSIEKLAEIANPDGTFLTLNQKEDLLYVGSEVRDGKGVLTVYDVAAPEMPARLAKMEETDGGAAYLATDAQDRFLFSCSYYSGTVRSRRLDENGVPKEIVYEEQLKTTGPVGEKDGPSFGQETPRSHWIGCVKGGALVLATDYAGDRLLVYRLLKDGKLDFASAFAGTPGDAIRHVAFHPADPTLLYLNTEYSGVIYLLQIDANTATLNLLAKVPALADTQAEMSSSIHLSPDGRFLLSANRTNKNISLFALSPDGKTMTTLPPLSDVGSVRDFIFAPGERYVLIGDQDANRILVRTYERDNGIGETVFTLPDALTPASFAFVHTAVS